jgi:hypothetical protein
MQMQKQESRKKQKHKTQNQNKTQTKIRRQRVFISGSFVLDDSAGAAAEKEIASTDLIWRDECERLCQNWSIATDLCVARVDRVGRSLPFFFPVCCSVGSGGDVNGATLSFSRNARRPPQCVRWTEPRGGAPAGSCKRVTRDRDFRTMIEARARDLILSKRSGVSQMPCCRSFSFGDAAGRACIFTFFTFDPISFASTPPPLRASVAAFCLHRPLGAVVCPWATPGGAASTDPWPPAADLCACV